MTDYEKDLAEMTADMEEEMTDEMLEEMAAWYADQYRGGLKPSPPSQKSFQLF